MDKNSLKERLAPKLASMRAVEESQRIKNLTHLLHALEVSEKNIALEKAHEHVVRHKSEQEKHLDALASMLATEIHNVQREVKEGSKYAADAAAMQRRALKTVEWEQAHRRSMENRTSPHTARSSSAGPVSEPRAPRPTIPAFPAFTPSTRGTSSGREMSDPKSSRGVSTASGRKTSNPNMHVFADSPPQSKGIAMPRAPRIRVGNMAFESGLGHDQFYNTVLSSGYQNLKPSTISRWWSDYQTADSR